MRRALIAAALLAAAPAAAQQAALCMSWGEAQAWLAKRAEKPVSQGQWSAQSALIIATSADGRTFSVFIVDVTGKACMMGEGESWDPGQLPSELRGAL